MFEHPDSQKNEKTNNGRRGRSDRMSYVYSQVREGRRQWVGNFRLRP